MGEFTIALAGNPNVGKSTVFNCLTGLRQHTGNWTGKTVQNAKGRSVYDGKEYIIMDLPGTYSLMSRSKEEEAASGYICFANPSVVVVVADATALERNLNLLLQIMEITPRVCLCINLMDEACKKGICIDAQKLSGLLGIQVTAITATKKKEAFGVLQYAERAAKQACVNNVVYDEAIETAIGMVQGDIERLTNEGQNSRFIALKLLGGETDILKNIHGYKQKNSKITFKQGTENKSSIANKNKPKSIVGGTDNLTKRHFRLGENVLKKIPKYKKTLPRKLCEQRAQTFCDTGDANTIFADRHLKKGLALAKEYLKSQGIDEDAFVESTVSSVVGTSQRLAEQCVSFKKENYDCRDRKIDKILTSKLFGFPIMLALLGLIFLITIQLANYPGIVLSKMFSFAGGKLDLLLRFIKTPYYIRAPLLDGIYKTTTWVIAVMLPPMAIFFPLFTLLEDLGYLPRVAFNLDRPFKKCGCCGKQCLTMCMGFGCNAVGVTGTRIIDSPRERLIAILTNNFVPCNGRFPTLIAVSSFFIGGTVANAFLGGLLSALTLTAVVMTGIALTFLVSKLLSKTLLKGTPSSGFSLELPPYRRPRVGTILVRSLLDRTIFVLGRAVVVAVPSGLIIWLLANLNVDSRPLLSYVVSFLQPLGRLMGLDGHILTSFILAFPANEIVIPVTIMGYTAAGSLTDVQSLQQLGALFRQNGWTVLTGINVLLFTLVHFPCATTCLTIKKETKSFKWTLAAMAIPTILGILLCMAVNGIAQLVLLIM